MNQQETLFKKKKTNHVTVVRLIALCLGVVLLCGCEKGGNASPESAKLSSEEKKVWAEYAEYLGVSENLVMTNRYNTIQKYQFDSQDGKTMDENYWEDYDLYFQDKQQSSDTSDTGPEEYVILENINKDGIVKLINSLAEKNNAVLASEVIEQYLYDSGDAFSLEQLQAWMGDKSYLLDIGVWNPEFYDKYLHEVHNTYGKEQAGLELALEYSSCLKYTEDALAEGIRREWDIPFSNVVFGENPKGKILPVREETDGTRTIDIGLLAALPDTLRPGSFDEVEFILLMKEGEKYAGKYTMGGTAYYRTIWVSLTDRFENVIDSGDVLCGGNPPQVIHNTKDAYGSYPSEEDQASTIKGIIGGNADSIPHFQEAWDEMNTKPNDLQQKWNQQAYLCLNGTWGGICDPEGASSQPISIRFENESVTLSFSMGDKDIHKIPCTIAEMTSNEMVLNVSDNEFGVTKGYINYDLYFDELSWDGYFIGEDDIFRIYANLWKDT